ncbi:MAG: alpha-galactosidase [Candidatus Alcyoniella australis]|nr:alpha-galactosidase [Candidatus Alcyoniella australis]
MRDAKLRWIWICLLLALCALLALAAACESDDDDDDDGEPEGDDDAGDDDDAPGDEVEVLVNGDELLIRNRYVAVLYHLDRGVYDVLDAANFPLLFNVRAVAQSHVLLPAQIWRSSDGYSATWESADAQNALGQGMTINVALASLFGGPGLKQSFTLLDGKSCVLMQFELINDTAELLNLGALYPLYNDPVDSALNLGAQGDLRVLTNGFLNAIDFAEPLLPGTAGSLSNWSALFYNQVSGVSLSLGFLTFEHALPVIYNEPLHGNDLGIALRADCEYDPPTPLYPGGSRISETLIFDLGQSTPQLALETYAERLKAWLGIQTWLERHPEIGVPVGWNSWSGSSSTGGYGTDINEQIIVENMDFADRELRRWGMNYFQIDDGWQTAKGDWLVNAARFPDHGDQNGIEWLMQRAKDLGFHTGLWVEAFHASTHSQVYNEHPEWITKPLYGVVTGDGPTLDLSNPEVIEYLTALTTRLRDWGIEWFKLDFAYWTMFTQDWYDPSLTRIEYYRRGVQALRQGLGEDVFLLNVAILGPNFGLIDSMRMTLDTMPAWEGESEDPYGPLAITENQGLKPQYREAARRYYFNGRVWVNHPDLIFFRSHSEPRIPPLTLDEARTFATAVALQGGLVKIGDRLVDLSGEAVDSLRRIIPPTGVGGRPLDLFTREFPEVWALEVADFDEPYFVLGLLNWGLNRDLTQVDYPMIVDRDRLLGADFAQAGLDPQQTYLAFEFWTQSFMGEQQGELWITVPAHSPRAVALRPKLGRPQLLGTNRHVLGGVGVIDSLEWDADQLTLSGAQQGSIGTAHAPFAHQISIYIPQGYSSAAAQVEAPTGYAIDNQQWNVAGRVGTLNFEVVQVDKAPGNGEPDWFPTIQWQIEFTDSLEL